MALEPVDKARCQAEQKSGNAFSLGGAVKWIRCSKPATCIATEREPGPDGECGAMSLCEECKTALIEKLGWGHCTFQPL